MNRGAKSLSRDESGAVMVLAAIMMLMLLGFAGLVIDVGYVYFAQRALQASTDAAALAGAQIIGTGGNVTNTALAYGVQSGENNYQAGLTDVAMTSTLECFTGTGIPCTALQTPSTSANAIQVVQTATVPTFLANLFGIHSWQISAQAVASTKGGSPCPYCNIAFIVDTTASMGNLATDSTCLGETAIECAMTGIQNILGGGSQAQLWPCEQNPSGCGTATNNASGGGANVKNPDDVVSLFTFPPVTNLTEAAVDYTSCGTNPKISPYYSGVTNTASAATSTATLSLTTSMTAATAFNTGAWAVATDAGNPTTTATATVLTFNSGVVTAKITKGLTVQDTTTPSAIPSGTTVASTSTTKSQVTMSQNVTVKSGDLITFGTSTPANSILPGSGGNAWPWWENTGSTTISSASGTTATMSAAPTGADVLLDDNIYVAPLYQIVNWSSDYRTSDTASALNSAADIVKATNSGCIGTPGGLGTYYADAITAAQASLVAEQAARVAAGQPQGQNVLFILSDGAANSTYPPSTNQMGVLEEANYTQECYAAVNAARNAENYVNNGKNDGTLIIVVYYDDSSPSCSDTTFTASLAPCTQTATCGTAPTTTITSSCTAMQDIASPGYFYSTDGTSTPCASKYAYTSIKQIFLAAAQSLYTARLLSNYAGATGTD
jgi:Flp pilus assembly protein TadG